MAERLLGKSASLVSSEEGRGAGAGWQVEGEGTGGGMVERLLWKRPLWHACKSGGASDGGKEKANVACSKGGGASEGGREAAVDERQWGTGEGV